MDEVGIEFAMDPATFPFRCELSLAPLITFWTQLSAYHEFGRGPIPGIVREKAREAPELAGLIEDLSVIEKHRAFVDLMMTAMFPPAFWEQEYGAALFPFQLRAFYATPPFRRALMGADGSLQGRASFLQAHSVAPTLASAKLLLAYQLILERAYGIDLGTDVPIIFTAVDAATGLDQHFRLQFDWRFVQVKVSGPKPPLTDAARQRLKTGRIDSDYLRELLPPERFVLRGFMIVKAVDVTDQEVLSSLKRDLIDKDSIVSQTHFDALQAKLRTFFQRPDLRLGLAAVEGDQVLVLNDASSHEQACIFGDSAHHTTAEFTGSVYERACLQNNPLVIEDLVTYPDRTPVEEELIKSGVRNFICAPLHYQEKVIGTLELVSPRVGDLNETHLPRLEEVLPLFSMAVQRSVEESVTRIAESISSYLELEEDAAQAMFPHYFEKQKTDGVDYQLYVGPALQEDGRFDPLCLRNLRLWQLMVTCGIAVRAHRLRDRLPIPLETTHLILVQHAPLSIRFRFDEKRFDVDGAYNIRYEIVKKRIDKAVVEGTSERVTQPGKLAIVYNQPAEALEYKAYIEYLQSLGYLIGPVESLELGELQGVQGLRALRVQIALDNPKLQERINMEGIEQWAARSSTS